MNNETAVTKTSDILSLIGNGVDLIIVAGFSIGAFLFVRSLWRKWKNRDVEINAVDTVDTKKNESWFAKAKVKAKEFLNTKREGMVGYYIGPIQIQLLRLVAPFFASIILTWIVIYPTLMVILFFVSPLLEKWIIINSSFLTTSTYILIFLGLWLWLWQPDEDPAIKVKFNFVVPLKIFGRLFKIFLWNGDYSWYLKKLKINLNSDPIPNSPLEGEKAGHISIAKQVFPIWNDKKSKSTVISVNALNNSEVFIVVTLEFNIIDPYLWITNEDARTAIGEEARSFIRELIPTLLDTDVPLLRSILTDLFDSEEFLLAYTLEGNEQFAKHKLVTNRSGKILCQKVRKIGVDDIEEADIEEALKEAIKEAIKANLKLDEIEKADVKKAIKEVTEANLKLDENDFKATLAQQADKRLLKLATDKADKEIINISKISTQKNIRFLLENLGANLVKISVSDVRLSDEVLNAAKKAASEILQREGHVASAITTKMVSKELQLAGFKEADAAAVAAVMDGTPISVIHLNGDLNQNQISGLGAMFHNAVHQKNK